MQTNPTRRPRGRPPLPPEERLGEVLYLRLDPASRALCEQAASHAGLSLSRWARETLRRAARRQVR